VTPIEATIYHLIMTVQVYYALYHSIPKAVAKMTVLLNANIPVQVRNLIFLLVMRHSMEIMHEWDLPPEERETIQMEMMKIMEPFTREDDDNVQT